MECFHHYAQATLVWIGETWKKDPIHKDTRVEYISQSMHSNGNLSFLPYLLARLTAWQLQNILGEISSILTLRMREMASVSEFILANIYVEFQNLIWMPIVIVSLPHSV